MTAAEAVRTGDILALEKLLAADPSLVYAYVDGQRTLLHVVSDWPGHFPNGPATVALLVRHGANPNARFKDGKHEETPLHWAASSNDIGVLNALIVAGADIEATGAVIAGGTPIADAVAFAQWDCARRLAELGAETNLWQAAALGQMGRVRELALTEDPVEITKALWCACHGSQQEAAGFLLSQGADVSWVGWDHLTPIEAAQRSGATSLVNWLKTWMPRQT